MYSEVKDTNGRFDIMEDLVRYCNYWSGACYRVAVAWRSSRLKDTLNHADAGRNN